LSYEIVVFVFHLNLSPAYYILLSQSFPTCCFGLIYRRVFKLSDSMYLEIVVSILNFKTKSASDPHLYTFDWKVKISSYLL